VEPDGMNSEERRIDARSGAAEPKLGGPQEVEPGAAGALEAPPSASPQADAQPGTATRTGAGRSLWLLIRRLVAGPTAPLAAVDAKPQPPEQLRDCLDMLDRHPGLRTTTIRLLGPHAADEGASFLHEHVETADEKGNARQTDLYITYRCTNNHWLDQNVRVLGTCFCGAILCSTPGCFAVCAACSSCCCSRHRKSFIDDGQVVTYCTSCFWKKYWFW